jgi:type I restriction enzyme R subunit
VVALLDRSTGGDAGLIISDHDRQLRRSERGYGSGQKPKDYLDSFAGFLRDNMNTIPALLVVTQRPRELTRQQLKELGLALDEAGYTEAALQSAWRDTTNQDIAASIIGFVRRAALGDALVPYAERVDRALKTILGRQAWTDPQRKWLTRIGDQLKVEHVVDPDGPRRRQLQERGRLRPRQQDLRRQARRRAGRPARRHVAICRLTHEHPRHRRQSCGGCATSSATTASRTTSTSPS